MSGPYHVETVGQARMTAAVERSEKLGVETRVGHEEKLAGTTRNSEHSMATCLKSWDEITHIPREQWDDICARTLGKPHI